jgi:acyl-coenzyme A synthetase/AMP-(fatty) acid ligase
MSAVKAARGPVYAPKKVRIVDTLPLTAAGKVDKNVLKELHSDLWAEG